MSALIITIAVAYFLGSIPFGFILVRAFRGKDIRASGSGNIGATNVARSFPGLGVLTLILDALKGSAAVGLTRLLFPGSFFLLSIAALFAVIGHMFPIWLRFRGGKGVATGLGSFILIAPKTVMVVVAIFIILVLVFRYISLASIIAVLSFPLLDVLLDRYLGTPAIVVIAGASLMIVLKHSANIRRLMAGAEPRFGGSK